MIPGTGPADAPERSHLFVILTDPCGEGKNLLVPVCSRRSRDDTTCLLGVNDHPFLKWPSYVLYARLVWYEAAVLSAKVLKKDIQYRGLMDQKVFALIHAGVLQSPFSSPKFKKYLSDQSPA